MNSGLAMDFHIYSDPTLFTLHVDIRSEILAMDFHIYSDPTLFTLHVDIRSEIKIIMRSIIQYGGASILCYKIKL